MRILAPLAIVLAAFGVGVGLGELFGAANLGVSFGIGQIAAAFTAVALIVRTARPPRR
ncbi:MAG: hypothetical protein ACJ76V_09205 [Thermoleophilaceae bacterium]